ncbi:MAG TPA: hypothetical protein VIW47_06695 [Nitrospiraceae bacterium]
MRLLIVVDCKPDAACGIGGSFGSPGREGNHMPIHVRESASLQAAEAQYIGGQVTTLDIHQPAWPVVSQNLRSAAAGS